MTADNLERAIADALVNQRYGVTTGLAHVRPDRQENWIWMARAAIGAIRGAGFAVVPVEPTEDMVEVGFAEIKPDDLPADRGDARACWAAMLAAAPKP